MKCKRLLSFVMAGLILSTTVGDTIITYAADETSQVESQSDEVESDGDLEEEQPIETTDVEKDLASAVIQKLEEKDYEEAGYILWSGEHPIAALDRMGREQRLDLYKNLKNSEKYLVKTRVKYDFVDTMIQLKQKETLDQNDQDYIDKLLGYFNEIPSVKMSNEDVGKYDQGLIDVFNKIYGEKGSFSSLDHFAETLQTGTDLDVMKVLTQMQELWDTPSDKIQAKTKEVKSYLYAVYGFDEPAEEVKDEENESQESQESKTETEAAMPPADHGYAASTFALTNARAAAPIDTSGIFTINMHDYDDSIMDKITRPGPKDIMNQAINKNRDLAFQYWLDDYYLNRDWANGGSTRWWNNYYATPNTTDPDKQKLKGIVAPTLVNGYPVLSNTTSRPGSSLAYLFNGQTSSGVIKNYNNLNYFFSQDENGTYYVNSDNDWVQLNPDGKTFSHESSTGGGFLPLNRVTNRKNMWFGVDISTSFSIPKGAQINGKDMTYSFTGDDDVWVFIDNVLVLDLGGIHGGATGSINFRTGVVTESYRYSSQQETSPPDVEGTLTHTIASSFQKAGKTWNGADGSKHTMKIFYLERGAGGGRFNMSIDAPILYDVVYHGNGATSGSTPTSNHVYGAVQNLTANGFKRDGHTFTGWNTKPDGSGTSYTDKQAVKNLTKVNGGVVNLYAQWKPTIYTDEIYHYVTGFKNDEGNNEFNRTTYRIGVTSFNANAGSEFVLDESRKVTIPNGLYLDNIGTPYVTGSYQSFPLNTKFVQQANYMYFDYFYSPYTYKITYELNGGTNNSANPSSYNVLYGVSLKNPTAPKGYKFEGWYIGDKKISGINEGKNATFSSADELYAELAKRTTGNITVTAKWSLQEYTVKYDGNGATGGSTASSTHIYDVEKTLTANGFTKTGYKFKGWNTKADGSGDSYTDKQSVMNLTTPGNTITLYAQWTPDTYTVKYGGNGATGGSTASSIHAYNVAKPLTANGFTKTGYTFKSWNTKVDGGGDSYTDKQSVKNLTSPGKTITLYAQWTPKRLVTTFHRNTSSTDTTTAKQTFVYDVEGQKFTDKGWTRLGYKLMGWSDSKTATTKQYEILSGVSNSWINKHSPENDVYAVWNPIQYTIIYDGNGATGGSTPAVTVKYDQTWKVAENEFTKKPFKFIEWNTKPDGSGTPYAPGTSLKNLTTTDGAKITLYAIWEEEMKVVYHGNGATSGTQKTDMVTESNMDAQHNYTVRKNTGYTRYAKVNNTFDGWNDDPYAITKGDFNNLKDTKTNLLSWTELQRIADEQAKEVGKATGVPASFRAVGFSGLANAKAAREIKTATMFAQWDEVPELTVDDGKSTRTFYEGWEVTEEDLLKGVTATDTEDAMKGLDLDIKVVKIEYAAGKQVDGIGKPAYDKTFASGMTDADKLDTWFLQMEKDALVCHKVTYQVTDSGGNTVQAIGDVFVKYNNAPTITAEDRYFTLEEAQAGAISEQVLLKTPLANGEIDAKDIEEGRFNTPGVGPKKVDLLDFDADEFKNFTDSGYRRISIHTQDSYGPGGKGKETVKQITVYVVKDGVIPDVNKAKEVRFIDEKNYEKNKDVDPETLTEAEAEARNKNGGLNVNSVWYHDPAYRSEIENTFDKTEDDGASYYFTLDEVEQVKEYVDTHGIGNMKEDDALSKFADQFLK